MKLYHFRGTRSARVRWLFEELGVPYHVESIDIFDPARQADPAHLRHHPHGAVPAVVDGELSLIESAAILLHYADAHPDRQLAPKTGEPERARYYQWIVYAAATVDPLLSHLFTQLKRTGPDQRDQPAVDKSLAKLSTALSFVAGALGDGPWLLGTQFTAADIAIGWDLALAAYLKLLDEPKLREYLDRLKGRPAFARAYAD